MFSMELTYDYPAKSWTKDRLRQECREKLEMYIKERDGYNALKKKYENLVAEFTPAEDSKRLYRYTVQYIIRTGMLVKDVLHREIVLGPCTENAFTEIMVKVNKSVCVEKVTRSPFFHEKAVHPDHREEYSTEGRELDPVVEHPRTTLTAYKAYYTSKGELLLEPDFSGTWRTANEPRSIIEMVIGT